MTITSREERSPAPSIGDSDHINYAKVVILGATGVGKTALIRVREMVKILNQKMLIAEICF